MVVEFDDPGDQHLVVGDPGVAQILPFMGVARIGRLERQPGRARPQRHLDDLGERDVVGVRPLVIAPAQMHAHRVGRDVGGRMVEGGDVALGDAQEFVVGEVLVLIVPGRAEIGRVDLQDEAGLVDRLVFLLQRIGQGLDVGILVAVVAVGHEFGQHPRRGGVHERLVGLGRGAGLGEVGEIDRERAAVLVRDRAGAARHRRAAEPRGAAALLVEARVEIGVVDEIAVGSGLRRLVVVAAPEGADAGEPVADVKGVGDLAELPVADAVDAGRHLLLHDLVHRGGETGVERGLLDRPAGLARLEEFEQVGRARQTADVGRQDALGAVFHRPEPR